MRAKFFRARHRQGEQADQQGRQDDEDDDRSSEAHVYTFPPPDESQTARILRFVLSRLSSPHPSGASRTNARQR
jgi:hypothetical protein